MKPRHLERDIISITRQETDNLNRRGNDTDDSMHSPSSAGFIGSVSSASPAQSWFTRSLLCGEIVPYLQTAMFGCIFLLRLPWVVGYCGIYLSLGIIALCMIAVTLTSLSLGAIGTDGKFSRFSTLYALLDKNLGREISSSVCLIFFCGRALAASMFCLAFSEALLWEHTGYLQFSPNDWMITIIATITCTILFIVCICARKLFITVGGMAALCVSFLCFLFVIFGFIYHFGSNKGTSGSDAMIVESNGVNDRISFSTRENFFKMLGICFPNFVGVFANLIRARKLPRRQLPRPTGIVWGSAVVSCVSIVLICAFGTLVNRSQLKHQTLLTGKYSKSLNLTCCI